MHNQEKSVKMVSYKEIAKRMGIEEASTSLQRYRNAFEQISIRYTMLSIACKKAEDGDLSIADLKTQANKLYKEIEEYLKVTHEC